MSANVTIYTTPVCPYCVRAKRLLDTKGVKYTEIDVDDRDELRSWLVSASGQRTVPQIFINGTSIGGFVELAELERTGRLGPMLSEPDTAGASAALPV